MTAEQVELTIPFSKSLLEEPDREAVAKEVAALAYEAVMLIPFPVHDPEENN